MAACSKKTLHWGGILFLSLFLFCVQAVAADITLEPLLNVGTRFENNYYRSENDNHPVMTYLLQPGINLGYKGAKTEAFMNYTLDNYFFKDSKSRTSGQHLADDDNYTGHTLNANGRYRATRRILLGLDETFYDTRDASQSDRLSNSVSRNEYRQNHIVPGIFYNFDPFTMGFRYLNTVTDYTDSTLEDSNENRGILDLIYKLNNTVSLDAEGQHATMTYDKNTPNYTADQFRLIGKKNFRTFVIEAGLGYQKRTFNSSRFDDYDSLIYHINVNSTQDLKTGLHVVLNYVSDYNDRGVLDSTGSMNYFFAQRINLDLNYDLSKRLNAGIGGYYQNSDYIKYIRRDDIYDVALNGKYLLTQWLWLSLSGGVENRDSNMSGYSYVNPYVMGGLNFAYDFGRKSSSNTGKTNFPFTNNPFSF
jgi:hypothetical protein